MSLTGTRSVRPQNVVAFGPNDEQVEIQSRDHIRGLLQRGRPLDSDGFTHQKVILPAF
jgi:hypothetical protein